MSAEQLAENVENVNKTVLDNGLTILTEAIDTVKSVSVGIWVRTGSRYEPVTEAGVTHFLEHMLFKGTENRSAYDIALSMESVGGYLNAFTSTELTCYFARCLDSEMPRALDVLSDMVLNPVFPEEELEKEKKVVLEEMKMYRDNPEDYIFEMFNNQLFKNDSLGRPIIGYEDTVNKFSRDHLYDYMAHQYGPGQLVIAVAGNVKHDYVVQESSKIFKERSNRKPPFQVDGIEQYKPDKQTATKSIEQTHYIIGRRGISADHEDKYLMLLLNTILGGGMSSRLHQHIREQYGYCYSIHSFNQTYADTGLYGIYAGTDYSYVDHLKELVLQEFETLQNTPVPEEELAQAKSQLKGKLLMAQESMSNRMMRLARSELYFKRYITLDELVREIDSVTPEQMKKFAESFFNPEQFTETLLIPENGTGEVGENSQ